MKVYPLMVGNVDIEGEDSLDGVYYTSESAMTEAQKQALHLQNEEAADGNDYAIVSVPVTDKPGYVGYVSLSRDDPEAPDYWWWIQETDLRV